MNTSSKTLSLNDVIPLNDTVSNLRQPQRFYLKPIDPSLIAIESNASNPALDFDLDTIVPIIRLTTGTKLTPREIECLGFWINGFSIKQTARALDNISIRTVQTFRDSLKKKLGVKSYQQLFQYVQQLELMPFFLNQSNYAKEIC